MNNFGLYGPSGGERVKFGPYGASTFAAVFFQTGEVFLTHPILCSVFIVSHVSAIAHVQGISVVNWFHVMYPPGCLSRAIVTSF